jgi:RNA polymerase sigma-70 factor, ECF subfamily
VIAESAMAGEAIALSQQEEDLLETAVREHSRLVYRIAYSVLRNPADAEDATQETFLRALRYGNKLARIQDQKAWLARIAWRVAVERRKNMAKVPAGAEEVGEALVAPGHGADRVLLERERSALLERLISALPSALRDPLVLSTLEEIAPREVASMLGISEAAVRSRAYRAREILRERLGTWMDPRK